MACLLRRRFLDSGTFNFVNNFHSVANSEAHWFPALRKRRKKLNSDHAHFTDDKLEQSWATLRSIPPKAHPSNLKFQVSQAWDRTLSSKHDPQYEKVHEQNSNPILDAALYKDALIRRTVQPVDEKTIDSIYKNYLRALRSTHSLNPISLNQLLQDLLRLDAPEHALFLLIEAVRLYFPRKQFYDAYNVTNPWHSIIQSILARLPSPESTIQSMTLMTNDLNIDTALFLLYYECFLFRASNGELTKAIQLFKLMNRLRNGKISDSPIVLALLAVDCERPKLALQYYSQYIRNSKLNHDNRVAQLLLKICITADAETACQSLSFLQKWILVNSFEPSYENLRMFAFILLKFGSKTKPDDLFRRYQITFKRFRTQPLVHAILSLYSEFCDFRNTLKWYQKFVSISHKQDLSCIKSLFSTSVSLDADSWNREMRRYPYGTIKDVLAFSITMSLFCRRGDTQMMDEVFHHFVSHDVVPNEHILGIYLKGSLVSPTRAKFDQVLQLLDYYNIVPSVTTLTVILDASLKYGDEHLYNETLQRLEVAGSYNSPYVYTIRMHHFVKVREYVKCLELFSEINNPNTHHYTIAICCLVRLKQFHKIPELQRKMEEQNVPLSVVTVIMLIWAYSKEGLNGIQKARDLLQRTLQHRSFFISINTPMPEFALPAGLYAPIVKTLVSNEQFTEAKAIFADYLSQLEKKTVSTPDLPLFESVIQLFSETAEDELVQQFWERAVQVTMQRFGRFRLSRNSNKIQTIPFITDGCSSMLNSTSLVYFTHLASRRKFPQIEMTWKNLEDRGFRMDSLLWNKRVLWNLEGDLLDTALFNASKYLAIVQDDSGKHEFSTNDVLTSFINNQFYHSTAKTLQDKLFASLERGYMYCADGSITNTVHFLKSHLKIIKELLKYLEDVNPTGKHVLRVLSEADKHSWST
ncbi:translation regulator [Schizosaccharomyces japonicus yFS275]|uniref:Translation regulator n=1 Tax=Schizosaccharomyces japonicus (strain yFS275 / FY16936) TaxID=402676 RepID=B6K060_SCHJY|nr:translation regulator [Schizosaccharomyces japonicus yFS275]EEB06210.1 translation regulator [Schizosaccharomyces japonicus yFS275]